MNLTLLEKNQIFGSRGLFIKKPLSIFEKYGIKAAITDFPILLGGYVSYLTLNNSDELKDRTGQYWTKTDDRDNDAYIASGNGIQVWLRVSKRDGGCRPALPFSSISKVSSNRVIGNDGVLRVEYGEYPQYAVSSNEQNILESLYNSNSLRETGKVYTTDSRKYDEYDKGFKPNTLAEYEYNGRKFVRVIANSYFEGSPFQLSNGKYYKDGDTVWVEVTPITWLVDEKEDIAVSERILVSGIQFNKDRNYKGDFSKTDMKKFMDEYLSKEIIPSKTYNFTDNEELQQICNRIKEINLQKMELENEKKKLEQDLIDLANKQKTKSFQ